MDYGRVLDELFAAAEAGDWATFRSKFADDAVLKQNVGPAQPIDVALETLPLLFVDGTTIKYENVRRVGGGSGLTEMHDAVFTKPDGRVIRLDICVVVQFDEHGKITRADEYLDSAAAAALR